jgi:heat shock protein HslJ
MKNTIFTLFIACCLFAACSSPKKITSVPDSSKLNGTWELNYISGPRIAFDGLYPNKKPTISFDLSNNRVSGNSSCNSFNGVLKVEGNQINFNEPMAMTRMACMDGNGEIVFMETLKKINSYSITDEGKTLNFIMGDIAMMRFTKK